MKTNLFKSTPPPINSTPRNANIDCLKALCVCFVVIGHFSIFYDYFKFLTSIAVPTFFMISGFLLWNADPEKFQQRLLKNLKNIAKITLWSSLLYIAIDLIKHYTESLNFESLTNFLIFNLPPFYGQHLWYLFAYIYVLIIYYFLSRWKLSSYLKYLVPIILLIMLLFGKYSFLYGEDFYWHTDRNFLTGISFFTIGLLVKKNIEIIRERLKRPIILIIVFLILAYMENFFLIHYCPSSIGNFNIFTIFLSTSFLITFILATPWKETWFSWIGKELSLYIYIFHWAIGFYFMPKFYKYYGLDVVIPNQIRAISYLLITILVSYIFVKTKSFIVSKIS